MKGFQEKTTGDGTFFVIKHHTICRESKTPQEGFHSIETVNPRTGDKVTKYIQEFSSLEAMITKIEWYDTDQKYETRYRGFKIHLDASGKHGVLDLPINARVTSRFMKLAENIDFTKPVEFRAWHDNKSDSTALLVAQNEVSVPQKYTRENPGDMPPPVQRASTGKWSYDDQMEFLHKRMMEVVIPKVAATAPAATQEPTQGNALTEQSATADAKLIGKVKEALTDLSDHDDYKERTRSQLLDEFFGTTKFAEVEAMPPDVLKAVLKKIDEIIVPF